MNQVMTAMEKRGGRIERGPLVFHLLLLGISICFMMVYACSVDPGEKNVKDTIIKHFESRGYRVVDIEIKNIEGFPLGKRDYMAPKKYTVQVPLITLEADGNRRNKEQSPFIFRNASITVRSTEKYGEWMVEHIKGIPLT